MRQALASDLPRSNCSFRFKSNDLQVAIETERLLIHSYKDTDFEDCISLYGNEAIIKYFDHGKARTNHEVESLVYEKGSKYFSQGKPFGLFSIFHKETKVFIGQIDFLPSDELGVIEVGFILHAHYHNQGFCSEAVKSIIFDYVETLNNGNFQCDELPINKVMATVHPKNASSRKVLLKAGMTLEKIQDRFGQPRLWYSVAIPLITKNIKVGYR
jgi:ribosomal-protein-alanine N-acetyltransferase